MNYELTLININACFACFDCFVLTQLAKFSSLVKLLS